MSVLGAAMRKLVHVCFGALKTRQPYQANYLASASARIQHLYEIRGGSEVPDPFTHRLMIEVLCGGL